jgi:DNA-binding response OmpR family regulator
MPLSSGEQVFKMIADFHPDLLLMDVMLSGMDGREICKDVKRSGITLPIILISASHDLIHQLPLLNGPNDFIAKPFDLDELYKKIEFQLAA